jgi:hypothetical protein
MERIQANELKVGEIYEVEFLNGSKLVVKFTGFNSGGYYFLNNKDGHRFSIANNCVEEHRFYKLS